MYNDDFSFLCPYIILKSDEIVLNTSTVPDTKYILDEPLMSQDILLKNIMYAYMFINGPY